MQACLCMIVCMLHALCASAQGGIIMHRIGSIQIGLGVCPSLLHTGPTEWLAATEMVESLLLTCSLTN